MIRNVNIADVKQLAEIYNYYVKNSTATFDDVQLSLKAFEEKMLRISKYFPFLVFEEDNKILGYAYGSKWRPKPAYNHTVESTVYVKHNEHGKQIGTKLYTELLKHLKQQKFHTVIGGLTLPNEASVRLHKKFGFKEVAHFKQVGFKFNEWLDVGFWQLNLD